MLYVEMGKHLYYPKTARFFQVLFQILGCALLILGSLSLLFSLVIGTLGSLFGIFCLYYSYKWNKGIKEYHKLTQSVAQALDD